MKWKAILFFIFVWTQNIYASDSVYLIPYSHLDTQWLWTIQDTIQKHLPKTLHENFKMFESYPNHRFNFSGAFRYQLISEYYPKDFEKLRQYIHEGRWILAGAEMEEGDTLIAAPESIVRQILYANQFYKKHFQKEAVDYFLPDCFGFPPYLPSMLHHAGIKSFLTQKLTWGSVQGIPFDFGYWEGSDGKAVLSIFDPGAYDNTVNSEQESLWMKRLSDHKKQSGIAMDFRMFGIGDKGGSPREKDIQSVEELLKRKDRTYDLKLIGADEISKTLLTQDLSKLPRYRGELLLKEHSTGVLTSQAYMKRWNRKNEMLADKSERAASLANVSKNAPYPYENLNFAWTKILENQNHDTVPGTSIPEVYDYAHNDALIAANLLNSVLVKSLEDLSEDMDSNTVGTPILLYNPLERERNDLTEFEIPSSVVSLEKLRFYDASGRKIPSQFTKKNGKHYALLQVSMPALSLHVIDMREDGVEEVSKSTLQFDKHSLESERFRVELNSNGDMARIYDKMEKRDVLRSASLLEFVNEKPFEFPSWNMYWKDRLRAPVDYLRGPVEWEWMETGPLRVSLRVKRTKGDSIFIQTISLDVASPYVDIQNDIQWKETGVTLKASFPLTVRNSEATYNWESAVQKRKTNSKNTFEVPTHRWMDLSHSDETYGVSILDDGKFGADKPNDHTLRLSLLFTPYAQKENLNKKKDEDPGLSFANTQDWGRHIFKYAIFPHKQSYRDAKTEWVSLQYNQPILAYAVQKHSGSKGRVSSFLSISNDNVALRAMKRSEDGQFTVLRFQEIFGKNDSFHVEFPDTIKRAYYADAQERIVSEIEHSNKHLQLKIGAYAPMTILVEFEKNSHLSKTQNMHAKLNFDEKISSENGEKFSSSYARIPSELWKDSLQWGPVSFQMGSKDSFNALSAKGQKIQAPAMHSKVFVIGMCTSKSACGKLPSGYGFIGNWYRRIFDEKKILSSLEDAYYHREPLAHVFTHSHLPNGQDDAYAHIYWHVWEDEVKEGALTLPNIPELKILAVTFTKDSSASIEALNESFDEVL